MSNVSVHAGWKCAGSANCPANGLLMYSRTNDRPAVSLGSVRMRARCPIGMFSNHIIEEGGLFPRALSSEERERRGTCSRERWLQPTHPGAGPSRAQDSE